MAHGYSRGSGRGDNILRLLQNSFRGPEPGTEAHGRLRDWLNNIRPFNSYALSIDVRDSTELLRHSRGAEQYSNFSTSLAEGLREIVLSCGGIYGGFTGDGAIAFFPCYITGPSAGLLCLQAAHESHQMFAECYPSCRSSFSRVLLETGLGIGIDYGEVAVMATATEVTFVGEPVVYACRLGDAPAGETLVNQAAYEQLRVHEGEYVDFKETSLDCKHHGTMLAYEAVRNDRDFEREKPEWQQGFDGPW